MKKISRIGVFTSGGDAPGMNAAVRAVVRTALYYNIPIYAIHRGYEGMIAGEITPLEAGDVGNIMQRGGTVIKTARSVAFLSKEGRKMAYKNLEEYKIDALVAIGGNGTFTGAEIFHTEWGIRTIGIPGTIDNDLYGTDYTLGFDTAINTAVDAVDKIRDTADSHNRVFFVEVMGRHSGYIGLHTGIGSGAGAILLPEAEKSIDEIVEILKNSAKRKKLFNLIIVAEGNKNGGAQEIAKQVKDKINIDIKVAIIGHLQRGGSPTAMDRLLASRMGFAAVEGLLAGHYNVMAGIVNDEIVYTPFSEAIHKAKLPEPQLIKMAEILAM
ncbi:MAG: 6-phosphofructokinase [Saprospiraceae bacterium]|nr:6-phosphofructokinase [Saprospiraceae bacterium]MBL0293896.1 6-phosphofructokinase [Saprospiraceae bacterium]